MTLSVRKPKRKSIHNSSDCFLVEAVRWREAHFSLPQQMVGAAEKKELFHWFRKLPVAPPTFAAF